MPFFGRESSRPCHSLLYLSWQCSEQGRLPHVTLEGKRAAASWLTQDLHTALKAHVGTVLSGSLVLVCQLLPMQHSRSKSEDCASEEQKLPMTCSAVTYKLQNVQIPPYTHIYTRCIDIYTDIHTHRVASPSKFLYPVSSAVSIFLHTALQHTGAIVCTGALQAVPSFPLLCCPQPTLFPPRYHLNLFPG